MTFLAAAIRKQSYHDKKGVARYFCSSRKKGRHEGHRHSAILTRTKRSEKLVALQHIFRSCSGRRHFQSSMLRKRPAAAGLGGRTRKRPAAGGAPEEASLPLSAATLPIAEKPEWYGEADPTVQIEVFLVTAAKLVNAEDCPEEGGEGEPPPLRDPATISKVEFREALQDSIAQPIYTHGRGGRPPSRTLELDVYVGVKEGKSGEQHHHAALKLFAAKHRFLPFKLAMRWRWGIATHWSSTHTQLWSAVRYLHCTTSHKPVVDKKPEIWTRDGRKLNLYEETCLHCSCAGVGSAAWPQEVSVYIAAAAAAAAASTAVAAGRRRRRPPPPPPPPLPPPPASSAVCEFSELALPSFYTACNLFFARRHRRRQHLVVTSRDNKRIYMRRAKSLSKPRLGKSIVRVRYPTRSRRSRKRRRSRNWILQRLCWSTAS